MEELSPNSTTVLVTGGSGFIALHLILQLLEAGYIVRTTVRSLSREPEVRKCLETAGVREVDDRLSFVEADLTDDKGWTEAAQGCTFVHHVASPFPTAAPKSEDELVVPARDGTLRVLQAARAAGSVKRVILTSSMAAIGYGHPPSRNTLEEPFTEKDWSVESPNLPAYQKSKTLAEKAAWDFVEKHAADAPELATINPVVVFGPVLPGSTMSTSVGMVKRFLDGSMPFLMQLYFSAVDVRDVADLHMRAMTLPAAAGQRFLAVADGTPISMSGISMTLRKERPAISKKVPTWPVPNWLVHTVALFDPTVRTIEPLLGHISAASNKKAKEVLGWKPRSAHEAILASADSLVEAGLV